MEHDVKTIKTMVHVIVLAMIGVYLSGCAIPLLLGVKERQTIEKSDGSTETRTSFITGADFNFGLSGTDTLNNNKGIKPNGQ